MSRYQEHITDQTTADFDPRTRRHVVPVRVVWSQGRVAAVESLLAQDAQTPCVMESSADQQSGILLDFGREYNGGVCISLGYTKPDGPKKFRIRFGESVAEAMGEPNQDHGVHDWRVSLPILSAPEFGLTGFRFVRIDLLDGPSTFEIRGVTAIAFERPLEQIGSFECSDDRLNSIWDVGRRTVHLCMQNYLLDGIKRDRLVWMGDIHPQVGVIHHVYGRQDVVESSLDILRDRTPDGHWMNGIYAYSIWWILAQYDWYWYTGNLDYLRQQHVYLGQLARRLATMFSGDGAFTGHSLLLDWATARDYPSIVLGLTEQGRWGMYAAARLAEVLDDRALAAECLAAAKKLRHEKLPETQSKQVAAMRILADQMIDDHSHEAKELNARILAREPADGLSPWFGLYILQARAIAGDALGALDLIRAYWGGMLDLGATTFWEHFDMSWLALGSRIDELTSPGKKDVHADTGDHCFVGLRHSLCHGWGSGPTTYLSRYVLGVHPAAPGYEKVAVRPMLGDLDWAHGVIPTPKGVIRVSHRRESDGRIATTLELPERCEQV